MTRLFLLPFLMIVAACRADETLVAYGADGVTWSLEAINDVPFEAIATIQFLVNGTVTGRAPCNQFSAEQTAPYPWLDLSPILSTKRACPDLKAEAAFFGSLEQMTFVEISGPVMVLSNETGAEMEFKALSGGPTDQ